MKKLLVVGAGYLQSFIIRKAKEMGLSALAVDADEAAPGFLFADKHSVTDIVDREACLDFARANHIDGVLTAATEYGVLTASYIAQEMHLPGLNYVTAQMVKNKYQTRRCLTAARVDDFTGQVYEVNAGSDVADLARRLHYPVMVKPCDGSGSRATCRVDTPDHLMAACAAAISSSITGRAEIEPFVVGKEYGAESLVVDGEIHVLAIMRKEMTAPPSYAELGHAIPCGLPAEVEEKAKACVRKAIGALGINSGAVNADLLITPEGKICIVDIGARMGGNMIGTCVIPYGTGIDYMGAVIKTALGETVDMSEGPHTAVATKVLAFADGIVRRLPQGERFQRDFGVELYHHMRVGDQVHAYHTNLDGLGYIVARGDSLDEASERAERALGEIRRIVFDDGI